LRRHVGADFPARKLIRFRFQRHCRTRKFDAKVGCLGANFRAQLSRP
jgi:hypothetical protein